MNKVLGELTETEKQSFASIVGKPEEQVQQENIAWEQPIPFDSFNLPKFPTDCLPDWVAEHVEAVAEDTQTPEDMAAVMTLGILAIPCAKAYKIEGKPGWEEPTNLYTAVIARPGERKSAIVNHIARPLFEYESEENKRRAPEIQKSLTEKNIIEAELSKLKKIAADKGGADNKAKALDKAEELSSFEEKTLLRLSADDITPEKLTALTAENNGRMAIVSAEGGVFDILAGRYTAGMNFEILLKGHSGDRISVDRMGRSSIDISDPAISVALTFQPEVLKALMENPVFRGKGLNARFLYSMPVSKVGARNIKSKPVPPWAKESYSKYLQKMLFAEVPEQPTILKLSPEAFELSIAFAEEIEPLLVEELNNIADWASKLHGAVLRIAAILHVAENISSVTLVTLVTPTTIEKAIKIGRYFIEHAKAAFSLTGTDIDIERCKYVLNKINKKSLDTFSSKDIQRLCRRKEFESIDNLNPILKMLCDHEYLKEFSKEREGVVKKIDRYYVVNPYFLSSDKRDSRDQRDQRKENYNLVSEDDFETWEEMKGCV
ncbi:MAG: hypothetical protein UU63_C0006G0006 [Candidatus Uhrbacteria bacterium GW2011_GWF2_41_430]|nr:MAG: hypothetical protein UU63_C0006G0006 [Candidatus Uhrbacteria bacterium GW2011_GWF2_41_430]